MQNITITLHGFPTKQDALDWFKEYGFSEQHFECSTALTDYSKYKEMLEDFENEDNLNVYLQHFAKNENEE